MSLALFGKQLDRDAYQPLWSTIRTALEQKHTFDGVYMDKYGNVDVLQSARRAVGPKSASNNTTTTKTASTPSKSTINKRNNKDGVLPLPSALSTDELVARHVESLCRNREPIWPASGIGGTFIGRAGAPSLKTMARVVRKAQGRRACRKTDTVACRRRPTIASKTNQSFE